MNKRYNVCNIVLALLRNNNPEIHIFIFIYHLLYPRSPIFRVRNHMTQQKLEGNNISFHGIKK